MKKKLHVIKHPDGLVEFRVNNRHVLFLPQGTSFEDARREAYQYVWARPKYRWDIIGKAA